MGYQLVLETWDCDACNGFGMTAPEGVEVCGTCGGMGSFAEQVDCEDCEEGKVACTGEFVAGNLVKLADGSGAVTFRCDTCKTVYIEERSHEEVVAIMGVGGHVRPAEGVVTVPATCSEDGSEIFTCAACQEEVIATIAKKGHTNDRFNVCQVCGTVTAQIDGAFMGRWYGGDTVSTAKETRNVSLCDLVGKQLTAGNLHASLSDDRFWGELVTNMHSGKVWQCVGFIPVVRNDVDDLAGNVFTNVDDTGAFKAGTLEGVETYIAEKGGYLYGTVMTEEMVAEWEEQLKTEASNSYAKGIMAVWFVADTSVSAGKYGEYNLTIEPVTNPELRENSNGIDVHCANLDTLTYDFVTATYNGDLVVVINRNAPNNAHVNLVPGLREAIEKINTGLGGNDSFQPGDRMVLNVTIDNRSGRTFNYNNGTGIIASNPVEIVGEYQSVGTGFDGFRIPVVDNNEYSFVPRRTNNQPLLDLGLMDDFSDSAVGAVLRGRGYGRDTELTDAEVAQTYLADYYLDWTNSVRETKNEEPAKSFEDLTAEELAVFTRGDNDINVFETCKPVAEALYYFYYARVFTYNGNSIYTHMKQYGETELETAIPNALSGTAWTMNIAALKGEEVPNGFQNSQFGFRVEFDLTHTPGGGGTTPDDEPEPPTPTDIPEPDVPLTNIPDEDVPLANIPDAEMPLAEVPNTGDSASTWGVIALASVVGLAYLALDDRKHRAEER